LRFRAVPVLALVGCVAVAPAQRGKYTLGGTVVGTLDPVQDACNILAWLPISGQLPARWEGSTTLGFARSQYRAGQWRMQDTNFIDHRVTITRSGADTILLSLSGPITAVLVGVWNGETFRGNWSCDLRFPFHGDTAIGGNGLWDLLPY